VGEWGCACIVSGGVRALLVSGGVRALWVNWGVRALWATRHFYEGLRRINDRTTCKII